MRLERIRHAHQQHSRLFRLSLHLHTQPTLFLLREQVARQPGRGGTAQEHTVVTSSIAGYILRFHPDGRSAFLLFVDGEGYAGVADERVAPCGSFNAPL